MTHSITSRRLLLVTFLVSLGGAPALAQPGGALRLPTDAMSQARIAAANDPAEALSRYLRVLSSNPRNLEALSGAGRAALEIGDFNAALGFYARAEEIAPRNGHVKAGLASAFVQMEQPREALRLFRQAVDLGVPEADIAADRGLAFDLRGDSRRAQTDYALALKARHDPETVRRYALSLAITGDGPGALAKLDPLLYARDKAAWRTRAFVLALTGDAVGARDLTQRLLPRAQAAAMLPFMDRLASLRPFQKAAAVHFGHIPPTGRTHSDAQRLADSRILAPTAAPIVGQPAQADAPLIPSGTPLGPAAAPAPSFAETLPSRDRSARGQRRRMRSSNDALKVVPKDIPAPAAPAASQASPPPAGSGTAVPATPVMPPASPVQIAQAPAAAQAVPAVPAALTPTAPVRGAPVTREPAASPVPPTPPAFKPAPSTPALATTAPVASDRPQTSSSGPPASAGVTSAASPVVGESVRVPAPEPTFASLADMLPSPIAPPAKPDQPQPEARAQVPPRPQPPQSQPLPAPGPVALPEQRTVYGPPASLALAAEPQSSAPTPTSPSAAISPNPASPPAVAPSPKPASPPIKLAEKPKIADVAAAAKPSSGKGAVSKDKGKEKGKEKDAKSADTEAARGKAAKDKAAGKKDEKPDTRSSAKQNPSRHWVQVAGGANKTTLPKEWARLKGKCGATLGSRSPWTTPLRFTNRLLVGPFKSSGEAQEFVNKMTQAGCPSFAFTSEAGQEVEKLAL